MAVELSRARSDGGGALGWRWVIVGSGTVGSELRRRLRQDAAPSVRMLDPEVDVRVLDGVLQLTPEAGAALAGADVVVHCPPQPRPASALAAIARCMSPEALLVDMTSLTRRATTALQALAMPGELVAVGSPRASRRPFDGGRALVAVDVRSGPRVELLVALLADWRTAVIRLTPAQHARPTGMLWARVQTFLVTYGMTLEAAGVGIDALAAIGPGA